MKIAIFFLFFKLKNNLTEIVHELLLYLAYSHDKIPRYDAYTLNWKGSLAYNHYTILKYGV